MSVQVYIQLWPSYIEQGPQEAVSAYANPIVTPLYICTAPERDDADIHCLSGLCSFRNHSLPIQQLTVAVHKCSIGCPIIKQNRARKYPSIVDRRQKKMTGMRSACGLFLMSKRTAPSKGPRSRSVRTRPHRAHRPGGILRFVR